MFSLIKSSFGDIAYIYKNLGHWIVSKVFISLSRYIIAFLFVLPFLIIFIVVVWFSPYSFLEYERMMQDILIALYPLWNNFMWFSIWTALISILLIMMTLWWIIAIFYNRILLAKLNLKYLDRKKLGYKKNLYFDRKMFTKYLQLSGVSLFILLIPIIIFVIWFLILFFVFWGTQGVNTIMDNTGATNWFSLLSFMYFIFCLVWFVYLLFRLYFIYFIVANSSKKTVKQIILKSLEITKWYKKLLKFIWLMLILFIAYMPLNYISQVIDFNAKSISFYVWMKQYIWKWNAQEKLTQEEFYGYTQLKQEYGNISDQELVGKARFMTIMSWIYFIFHFVFLYWIFDMVLAWFYKRELLKK